LVRRNGVNNSSVSYARMVISSCGALISLTENNLIAYIGKSTYINLYAALPTNFPKLLESFLSYDVHSIFALQDVALVRE